MFTCAHQLLIYYNHISHLVRFFALHSSKFVIFFSLSKLCENMKIKPIEIMNVQTKRMNCHRSHKEEKNRRHERRGKMIIYETKTICRRRGKRVELPHRNILNILLKLYILKCTSTEYRNEKPTKRQSRVIRDDFKHIVFHIQTML